MYQTLTIPVYGYSAAYAGAHHQMDPWSKSHQANVQCCNRMKSLLRTRRILSEENFTERTRKLIAEFGRERVMFICCLTVRKHILQDGNGAAYSAEMQRWATTAWPAAEARREFLLNAPEAEVARFVDLCNAMNESKEVPA